MKLKLAILASRFPYPLDQGDRLRLYHQIRQLSDSFDVYLVCTTHENVSESSKLELQRFCKETHVITLNLSGSICSAFRFFFSGLPLQLAMFYTTRASKQVDELLFNIKPDVVYCHLFRMAEYCKRIQHPKVIDLMDAFSASMQRRSGISRFPLNILYKMESVRIKKYEEKITQYFDSATIISEQDKSLLSGLAANNVYVVPNGVDTDFFNSENDHRKEGKPYDLVFVGNMGYLPNIEAAEYLVNSLMPGLAGEGSLKTLNLHIAGSRPSTRVKKLSSSNVTVSGWLDDIRVAYHTGKVFCAPIFSGTGQQNKILEAMAMGVPCITTSAVNNAIGARDYEEILVADDTESFKNQINLLLKNDLLKEKLSKNARKFVVQKYSWKEMTQKLGNLLIKISQKNIHNK